MIEENESTINSAGENEVESIKPISDSSLSLQALRFSKSVPEITPIAQNLDESSVLSATEQETADNKQETEPLGRISEPKWLTGLKAAGVFGVTFLVVFLVLEGPAFYSRFTYSLTHLGERQSSAKLTFLPKLLDQPVTITDLKERPDEYFLPNLQLAGYSLTDLGDNQLLIPKITVNVPIVWGSSSDEATVLKNLQNGVVQYDFTARPSDGTGNVFLIGHSSYSLWDPGKYKSVFANLDRLETGDQLALTYQGIVYLYEVTNKKVVKPSDLSVLDQTAKPTLSLMTCVPVGTDLNRLIVSSKLISARPNRPIPLPPPALADPASIFHYLPI